MESYKTPVYEKDGHALKYIINAEVLIVATVV